MLWMLLSLLLTTTRRYRVIIKTHKFLIFRILKEFVKFSWVLAIFFGVEWIRLETVNNTFFTRFFFLFIISLWWYCDRIFLTLSIKIKLIRLCKWIKLIHLIHTLICILFLCNLHLRSWRSDIYLRRFIKTKQSLNI